MRRTALLTFALVLVLGLMACSDGDGDGFPTGTGRPFELDLAVVDQQGNPVSDVAVGSMPAIPHEIFPWGPGKSRVTIPMTVARSQLIRLTIRDLHGSHIRTLIDDLMLVAGAHRVVWDGRDDAGQRTPSGYYTVHMWVSGDDGWEQVDGRSMLQTVFDPADWSWGVTDLQGHLVIRDSRLVPGLDNPATIAYVDESGESQGSFELTGRTWLYLTRGGDAQWAEIEVTASTQNFQVRWNAKDGTPTPPEGGDLAKGDDDIPPMESGLGHPYPNPFN